MSSKQQKIYFRGMREKLDIVASFFQSLIGGRVLDVGCGESYLRKLVVGKYVGIDNSGNPDVKKDINGGLPFGDKSFDTVLALDVLEHANDIYFIFDESCRVARKWVIISLPNMYEWRFRISFLLGKFGSVSNPYYGLPESPSPDRHHWLFSLNEAKNFVKKRAEKNNFEILDEINLFYKYNNILPKIITKVGGRFGKKFQNLFVNTYLVALKRKVE